MKVQRQLREVWVIDRRGKVPRPPDERRDVDVYLDSLALAIVQRRYGI